MMMLWFGNNDVMFISLYDGYCIAIKIDLLNITFRAEDGIRRRGQGKVVIPFVYCLLMVIV